MVSEDENASPPVNDGSRATPTNGYASASDGTRVGPPHKYKKLSSNAIKQIKAKNAFRIGAGQDQGDGSN